jgi:hypothetical protein
VTTFSGADSVEEGSEGLTGCEVRERLVWDRGEEIVPDWAGKSMAGLEATEAEGWGEER